MRRRIPRTQPPRPARRGKKGPEGPGRETSWESRILLYLKCDDPRLLDKEASKVHQRIVGTGAGIQGPIPLPVEHEAGPAADAQAGRVHRRLLRILLPTEETVTLLDKLALSESVQASIRVETMTGGAEAPGRAAAHGDEREENHS